MSKNKLSYFSSSHIFKNEDSVTEFHAICPDKDQLKSLIEKRDESEFRDKHANNNLQKPADFNENSYKNQINTLLARLFSYYDITYYFTDLLPVMPRYFFRDNIVEYSKENFEKVDEHHGSPIYAIDETEAYRINNRIDKLRRVKSASPQIQSSILLSLVATYDAVFSDYCKFLLRKSPDKYTGSNKTFSIKEILSLGSIEDVYDRVIDHEIDGLMNSSHTEQMEFFEKNFHINFVKNYERWHEYVEIFERRNLAAHCSLVVNNRYLENCKTAGCKNNPNLSETLVIDHEYMKSALDTLIEVFVMISFAVWRKRMKDEVDEAFSMIVETSFNLLTEKQSELAVRITNFALSIDDSRCDAVTRHMLTINNAIGIRRTDGLERCKEKLSTVQWSALSPIFRLCSAAMQSEVEECVKHLESAKIADNLDIVSLREWPVFEWVRENEDFSNMVEKIFGEPLIKPKATINDNESNNGKDAKYDL